MTVESYGYGTGDMYGPTITATNVGTGGTVILVLPAMRAVASSFAHLFDEACRITYGFWMPVEPIARVVDLVPDLVVRVFRRVRFVMSRDPDTTRRRRQRRHADALGAI